MAETYQYQGFWIRLCAYTIDSIILSSIAYLLGKGILFWSINPWYRGLTLLAGIIAMSAIYETVMVGRFGGTAGKLLLRMRIISDTGTMNYKVAFVRWASTILSTVLLMIGYLMIAWDPRKQALHDRIAKTLVIRDENSVIPPWARTTAIVAALLVVISYITFVTMVFATALTAAIQSETKPLDASDPEADLLGRCDLPFDQQHDICLQAYQYDPALLPRAGVEAQGWCDRMRTGDARAQCYAELAAERQDPSLCETLPTFQRLVCQEQYEMIDSVKGLLTPPARNITGELEQADLSIGLLDDGVCKPVSQPRYRVGQIPCITISEVGAFELGADGFHHYTIDAKTWRFDGAVLADYQGIQSDGPVKLLNGMLRDHQATWNLSGQPSGEYTYEITIQDQVSKRGVRRNWTIALQEDPVPGQLDTLPLRTTYIGTDVDGTCVRGDNRFFDNETACFVVDVGGLEIGEDDLHRFEMTLKTRTADGSLYQSNPRIFGDDGHLFLRENATGKTRYVITRLWDFPPGTYDQEITVHDLVGGGQRTVHHNFTVSARPEPRTAINIVKLKIGVQQDGVCEGEWDAFTFERGFSGRLCAEPYATGFEQDPEGDVRFDMDVKVVGPDGDRVLEERSIWGEEGVGYLEEEYLSGYSINVPTEGLSSGAYSLTLTVYDTFANTKGTATRTFSVE